MIGVFRLESQMLPGNGKLERTGLGSDRDAKESSNTAFNYLKANGNRISGSISTTAEGLHYQLSGSAGNRYDREAGSADADCTVFYRFGKTGAEFHGDPG